MRVLLVEDDPMIGQALVAGLRAAGMAVDWARDGLAGQSALADGAYAIALLDLALPGLDGLTLLQRARRGGVETPVLVITARDGLDDRVAGLDLGADDYLVKPFEMRELQARMRALLRRRAGRAAALLSAGSTELNTETHEMTRPGAAAVLPAREYALMLALLERPGRILSRAQIEERIYGWGEEVESNAVDVLIHSIRRKFGKDAILNVRGAGWLAPKT
ncbi:MAG: response regulator transcription factor [Hyphomicrobiales bacterium]|nr:response regulator transcription factor [Hyphomicrobiales bacterium]